MWVVYTNATSTHVRCHVHITARYLPAAVPDIGVRVTLKLLPFVVAVTQTESARLCDAIASLTVYDSCVNDTETVHKTKGLCDYC